MIWVGSRHEVASAIGFSWRTFYCFQKRIWLL